jgi:hypothetical protein
VKNNLRDRFGKLCSFPASIHAIGNDEGGPSFKAFSKTIVIASMYTTISGVCAGEMFCKQKLGKKINAKLRQVSFVHSLVKILYNFLGRSELIK